MRRTFKRRVRLPSVVHHIDDVNLTAYTYNKIYASEISVVTVNGTAVTLPKGGTYVIDIRSVSGDDIYLFGYAINNKTGLSYSGLPEEHLGGSTYLGQMSQSGGTSDVIGTAVIGTAIIG